MPRLTTIILFTALAFGANADPIVADQEYHLGNHPDGNAADPLYGLRLDGLLTGDTNEIYTFDFDASDSSMKMVWDSATNSLTIEGTAFGGQDAGSDGYISGTTATWTISFTYTGVYQCGSALCADDGTGWLESGDFGRFDLVPVGKKDYGYNFKIKTGHRHFAGISGLGWLNHCEAGGNPDSVTGGSCSKHIYASDWLFTASVPEPATIVLLGIGLLGLGLRRRRQQLA